MQVVRVRTETGSDRIKRIHPGQLIRSLPLPVLTCELFELDGNEFGNAGFLHGHAVKRARGFHRPLVVGDNDELRVRRHGDNFIGEAADICFIEGRIDFVE